jgi:uncharacterized protein YeaO (DUF488 family)
MGISIVRLGSPRAPGEGLRLGTARRPPRGVPKSEHAARDFYDVWLPLLSPSPALVKQTLAAEGTAAWRRFVNSFRKEMSRPDAAHTLDLLAALSHRADFSVGCYCEDASRCHRGVLRELPAARGAKLKQ